MMQTQHASELEYASPVLRATSPASSLNTACPDQTPSSDNEDDLPQPEFERKWEERLGIGLPRPEELQANESPLLPLPNGPAEEKALFEQVMHSLRHQVQLLEENEIFEQTLLKGSQVGLEIQPSSRDIDALIQNLMSSDEDTIIAGDVPISNGPWNYHRKGPYAGQAHDTTHESATTAGKRSVKGKGNNRKA